MVRKLFFFSKFTLPTYLIICFFAFSTHINAQCAGNDKSFSVCDIANASSQSIDLNTYLDPTHTIGGTWTDDNNSGGLNTATGVLNAQKVYQSGKYRYTYTVNGVLGCIDNTATIEVTIGGYAGIPGPNNSICSSDRSYSLFQVFKGAPVLAPQSGGTWKALDFAGGLNTATGDLDAAIPPPYNTYSYEYTINAIGSCPKISSQVSVSIYRSPEPGTPSNLSVCSNQVGAYTNLNLNNSLLSGEDAGGTWTESGTSEISNSTDSTINVQNIYNTKGAGYYYFTYTVYPPKDDRVCRERSSTVMIAIGEQLDFTGATLAISPNPVCENNMATTTYTGILRQGLKAVANGTYTVNYLIAGVRSFTTIQNFSNGILTFPIATSNFTQVQDYTISIIDVTSTNNPVFCSSIINGTIQDVLHIFPSPKINSATLTIDPVCLGSDATVQFSGTSNLTDGVYDIVYNLSGSNTLNGIPATMNIVSGVSTPPFQIPAAYISRTGVTTITIAKITSAAGCPSTSTLKKDFIVNPPLNMSNLVFTVKNTCVTQSAEVTLTGLGNLTSIEVTYNLSGSNIATSNIATVNVVSGSGTFLIPASEISVTGPTSFNITNITNTITGCFISVDKPSTSFIVNPLPNVPSATTQPPFCTLNNPTVANLLPQGNQYQWFDTVSSTVPLANTTLLQTRDYFVKEVNLLTGCASGLLTVPVVINPTPQINNATLSIATVCQTNDVDVDFGGTSNLTNGIYRILYNLTGNNIATSIQFDLTINNGRGRITIPKNLVPKAGQSTITITSITNTSTSCSNTANLSKQFTINPMPDISNMIVTIKDVCQGQPATIELSGLGSLNTININYSLENSNIVNLKTIPLIIDPATGKTSFQIPATDIPKAGLTTFNMTDITNTNINNGCSLSIVLKVPFTVNPLPTGSNIVVTVKDGCPNQPLKVDVSGLGTLTSVTFTYSVSGANTINSQTVPLVVNGGNTSFTILGSLLSVTGNNTLIINGITNLITTCAAVISSTPQNFAILPIPNNPVAHDQGFCKENSATIANLVPNGSQYKWYDSINSTTPLQPNTLLIAGNYYLREVNLTTGCESNATTITVSINSVPTPTLKTDGEKFCGADKPTIQNLSNNTNYTGDLTWYNSPTNGTAIANTDLLAEGTTYYAIDYNPNTKCVSDPMEATVTLISCSVTPDGLTIPDGFSPNGDGVNDTFKILDIEYLFPNFTLEIFNRYGNIMFKGNINQPDWDGKNSNASFINGDAATGVYFYIINYNKDNLSPRQGQLYLNR